MEQTRFLLGEIPAILWGPPGDRGCLYIHGQGGGKEYAAGFAELAAAAGRQVLSIDLPEHGERAGQPGFDPWHAVPDIQAAADWARSRWSRLDLRADSIGAWFSMLALGDAPPERALFVSPVLDMARLIETMMDWAGVTEAQLEQAGELPTDFGQTLSWDYLCYARSHPIRRWNSPTDILYAGRDHLVGRDTVDAFVQRFGCGLTVLEEGEHWFHTPEQLAALEAWTRRALEA